MTARDLVETMAKGQEIERLVNSIGQGKEDPNDLRDLCQELYVYLLGREDIVEKYESGYRNWKNFLIRMILNQIYSSNSGYFCKYKRYTWMKPYSDEYFNRERAKEAGFTQGAEMAEESE